MSEPSTLDVQKMPQKSSVKSSVNQKSHNPPGAILLDPAIATGSLWGHQDNQALLSLSYLLPPSSLSYLHSSGPPAAELQQVLRQPADTSSCMDFPHSSNATLLRNYEGTGEQVQLVTKD